LTKPLSKLFAGKFIALLVAVVIASNISAQQTLLDNKKALASDTEVVVTIAVPAGNALSGTAIVSLEDITVQDAPAVQLASVSVDVSSLQRTEPTIVIPINLRHITAKTDINVAVHIDADNNGLLSEGDWISDSIVRAISNAKMAVVVDVVRIGTQ